MRSISLVAALWIFLSSAAVSAAEGAFEEKALTQLLAAIQSGKSEDFTSLGDERFKTMPAAEFTKTTNKFAPLLKVGYKTTYLGAFNDTGVKVHYWKLEIGGEPHDWLAKMAVADGKVKGFFITRP